MKAQSQAPTRKTKDAVEGRQNNQMLRQCPFAIVQQLVYDAVAVSTAVRKRQHLRSTLVADGVGVGWWWGGKEWMTSVNKLV